MTGRAVREITVSLGGFDGDMYKLLAALFCTSICFSNFMYLEKTTPLSSDYQSSWPSLDGLPMAPTSADDKGPHTVAAAIAVIVIQVVVVILRFWSRAISVRAHFWWDDWMVLAALVHSV